MARWVRPALLGLLVVAGVVVALTVDLPQVAEIRAWVRAAGWAAPVVYALGFALVSLTPAPATVLTVGAGGDRAAANGPRSDPPDAVDADPDADRHDRSQ